jgi:hypothetical protein
MTDITMPARRWGGGRDKSGTDRTSNSYPHCTSSFTSIQPHKRVSGGSHAN